jgi:hypothetical protein
MLQLFEMYIQVVKRTNYGKEKFDFAALKVRSRLLLPPTTLYIKIPTKPWVLQFGSYSVAMQQVNRIVPDMCVRWQ